MLKNLGRFYHPTSVEEACNLLADTKEKKSILAGGTHLASVRDESIEALVDLKDTGLTYVKASPAEYAIGSMTPVQDIFKSAILTGPSGEMLRKAAGAIGSTLLRNSITAGGNIAATFPWSDLPPALLVLDATVTCRIGKPKRTVPIESLLESSPRDFLKPNEIITEIQVPLKSGDTGFSFVKFAKTRNDYSMITVATGITIKNGLIDTARVALNAITRKPQRRIECESFLQGKKPEPDTFREAARLAARNLDITADFRASKEYRTETVQVLVRRSLEESYLKASGKGGAKR